MIATPTELIEERLLFGELAAQELLAFSRLTMPDADEPWNPRKSSFIVAKHHRVIASHLEKVESGEIKRLIIVLPPRHGKTELAVRRFVAWCMGRDPKGPVIVATYSDTFSQEHGRNVRACMTDPAYKLAFPEPEAQLRNDSKAADRLETVGGGVLSFVGRGGSITGRGAKLIVIDDPVKDADEANSKLMRDKQWEWLHGTVMDRFNTADGRIILIQTRWHEDDLVGRLTDPNNKCYDATEAAKWTVLHLPRYAEENDTLGRPVGQELWPGRFDETNYRGMQVHPSPVIRRTFYARHQGKPRPDEGAFFKLEWIVPYTSPSQIPANLRKYIGSDHAVRQDEENDDTVQIPAGVDQNGDLWVLPDVWWDKKDTYVVTEAMLKLAGIHRPLVWFSGKDHITGSIGPFLRKRMQETGIYFYIKELSDVKDKPTKAQPLQGRMAQCKIHLPTFAEWYGRAEAQLIAFPNGNEDDFIDALANICRGLDLTNSADIPQDPSEGQPKPGTLAWVKQQNTREQAEERTAKATKGW